MESLISYLDLVFDLVDPDCNVELVNPVLLQ